jgi:hypothetical protein
VLGGDMVLGDGAYHTKDLPRTIFERGGTLLSPPPKNAKRWGRKTLKPDEPNVPVPKQTAHRASAPRPPLEDRVRLRAALLRRMHQPSVKSITGIGWPPAPLRAKSTRSGSAAKFSTNSLSPPACSHLRRRRRCGIHRLFWG